MPYNSPHWLKDFYPGYFAMTMATGIISVALRLQNYLLLAEIFFVLTIMTWLVMTSIYTWRLIKFPKTVVENLKNPKNHFYIFHLCCSNRYHWHIIIST